MQHPQPIPALHYLTVQHKIYPDELVMKRLAVLGCTLALLAHSVREHPPAQRRVRRVATTYAG